MLDQEQLLELTQAHLKSLVAAASGAPDMQFDAATPFGELGVDSFRVLRIIKDLEADFGTLPKTLLFENFNVESLAGWFVARHAATLQQKLGQGGAATPQRAAATTQRAATAVVAVAATPSRTALRLLEQDLPQHPELQALVLALFERHKNEGCVSRGTRSIAPNLFVGSARRGYFNYGRCNELILVYAYTGPEAYFAELAQEMLDYCREHGFQLNLFTDVALERIADTAFSATPFGALQRVLDIGSFTLEGGDMRRLRYQVGKFEKAGAGRTVEYACGSDTAVDAAIAAVIDEWCAARTMVNPLVHIVRQEILAGTLHAQHRVFLTYLDDVLQNVILISAMSAELNGYLMDLEFYPRSMPLGGLEFAIVNIIRTLVAEGCGLFSLGGTYGCRLGSSPNADAGIDRLLDELHSQNIFNDSGNLQFKNKFRPENRIIYLCRPVGSGKPDNVIDIIMMIADPARQTSDAAHHNANAAPAVAVIAPTPAADAAPHATAAAPGVDAREIALAQAGYNPLNLAATQVDFDLKTDSWAQLETPSVQRQMAHLRSQLQQAVNLADSLKAVFPFQYFVLTDAGRSADHVLCKAWPRRGIVLQNLLFPTCIYHQIDNGLTPHEIPHPDLFDSGAPLLQRAQLCLDTLRQQLATQAAQIAYVCVELCDNAAGGMPVAVAHLRAIRQLLQPHGIALVVDATRVLENAQLLLAHDPGSAGRAVWDVARETLACADVVYASLAKDFRINRGGLIATSDEALLRRFQEVLQHDGGGLDVMEKKLVGLALQQRSAIEAAVQRRVQATQLLWDALDTAGLPLFGAAGGHCVLVDVKRIDAFAALAHPLAAFVAWLYGQTGVRAGAHSVGMQQGSAINGLVRLAVPLGLTLEDAQQIGARIAAAYGQLRRIPELAHSGSASESFGEVQARYTLVRHQRDAAPAPAAVAVATPATVALPVAAVAPAVAVAAVAAPAASTQATTSLGAALAGGSEESASVRGDIAVIGMAGRYPQAASMAEFWRNLREGRDCITELPESRRSRRLANAFSQGYRGGFIADVDKFDSLFFNISPREAEVLDPQERLFLEVAWETLEDAGYYPELLAQDAHSRRVGVFVGAVWAMYQMAGVEQKLAGHNANPNSFLWSIANRVSYWMNFTGPSLTVDTACSSSLTAIHLACEAIHNGECSSAIVGGVNLDLHQHKFDINNAGGALSPDGVCRSFGAGANGYVAGEGVGAILLKPLQQALEDQDQIYGVIRGSVVNHGGRTSGYTVPNPKAQGDLVAAALEKAGVDAASIGYVEAHGTGTELGDPIEIAGLCNAFASVAPQHCAIGSVKTNIGHLEAAAGVVGVCKALLQIRHRELVPSLHSGQLNAHIDFAASPFVVQQQLQAWAPRETDGRAQPLRAGISSFGAGGANAHVVVEEFLTAAPVVDTLAGEQVFPLSARNEEQLRDMAARLQQHLVLQPTQALADIAYTLQHGRKSFDHRLAIVADSVALLRERLGLFLAGTRDDGVLLGHARNADNVTRLLSRREKEQFVELLAQGRDPRKLAQLWIDGLLADCSGFAAGGRRTSLPTYPFADKRHWIGAGRSSTTLALGGIAGLHPLIDSNESTFQRQLFNKTFHEHEFFLRDHVVSGLPTLPGTAYLDLARKAGEIAAGRPVRKIRNITWVSPLTVDATAPTEARIELKPAADGVLFEVFSDGADGRRKLYAQGKLIFAEDGAAAAAPEYIDLAAIRTRCAPVVSGVEAYPLFRKFGLDYGPSFQLLQQVWRNGEEVLGQLQLPPVRSADFEQFQLHPCLLDAAMQAGVAGQLNDAAGSMKVPYSIGEVELLQPLTTSCYSYITQVRSERGAAAGLSRENVVLVDETGRVLARIRDSVGVPLSSVHEKPAAAAVAAPEETFHELQYSHAWQPAALAAAPRDVQSLLLFDRDDSLYQRCRARGIDTVLVMPGSVYADLGEQRYRVAAGSREDYERLLAALSARQWAPAKICHAWADATEITDAAALSQSLQQGVHALLAFCQALIETKPAGRTQLLYVYPGDSTTVHAQHAAINGFVRTLRLENPRIDAKALEFTRERQAADTLLDALLAELHAEAQQDISVRYEGGQRFVRSLRRLDTAQWQDAGTNGLALKQQGVYLITGGAGGLGLIFAEYLARQCQARLVLTGRSALAPEREAQLQQLRDLGAEVLYIAADVSRAEDVQRVLAQTREQFGALHGIVHGAGVLRDSFLRKKTAQEMDEVFAPKIFGAFHLDAQTREEALDFFVSFSSLAALGGNTGQCDYAYANHWLDSFSAVREAQRAAGTRSGRTLSLNWSLWADGGMKLDEQTELFFRKNLGIKPLETAVGLDAFTRALALEHAHVAVLQGVQARIEQAWGLVRKEPAAPATAVAAPSATGSDDLAAAVTATLSELVMQMLMLSADELSLDAILLDLGFDSIGLTTFANAINERYRLDINPVLFFEYPSIRAVAGVLASEHATAVGAVHGKDAAATTATPAAPQGAVAAAPGETTYAIDKGQWSVTTAAATAPAGGGDFSRERRFIDQPIAIVGIAGRMPQSDNLDEFWAGLRDARDLVTEIPRDRWIWEDYHGNPVKETNKSNSRWGGFMKQVDEFDPLFFGITPREAEMMDPQQRLFIEAVWGAIEDAGHRVSDLSGTKTGLFVGASSKDYIDVLAEHNSSLDGFSASGNSHSILANRISFLFNLRGPSAPLDTACSSSLIALHRAIESIHTGSSDMAIVGGVQVMLTPIAHISLSSAGMLSIDGKCKTFDKDANGYVRGEGVGAILIKPLAQAQADGNPIYAVIKSTAENHGGRVTMLTAPNPKAQAELLLEAYSKAEVDPTSVGYIECHGTGTSLGDPIEIQALKKSFADLYKRSGKAAPAVPHCGLSSVKTNIGHLEPAAGIASLLKVLLAIKHRQIPALLHFETLNPYIDLQGSPFYIVDKTRPWDAPRDAAGAELPRRAGVSSFGWGGANAHVVLEEYVAPSRNPTVQAQGPQPIVLSARHEDRLKAYAQSLLAHLRTHTVELADLAYTLQVGRDAMDERLGLVADSVEDLMHKLGAYVAGEREIAGLRRGRVNRYKRNEQGLSVAEAEAARPEDIAAWIAQRDHARLLGAWVAGAEVEWSALHAAAAPRPRRLSLPSYPFARERNWIDTSGKNKPKATAAALHPLLQANASVLGQQRFSTRFSGKELLLIDHAGSLPAFAWLEMARIAVMQSRAVSAGSSVVELLGCEWGEAGFAADSAITVSVQEGKLGRIGYEIHSSRSDEQGRSQRQLQLQLRGSIGFDGAAATTRLDIAQLQSLMHRGEVDAAGLTAALDRLAPQRGAALRSIRKLYRGDGQLLLQLAVPALLQDTAADYVLHPALFDGVLQAALLLATDFVPRPGQPSQPQSLASLRLLTPPLAPLWAWIRPARGSRIGQLQQQFDIDLTDAQGAVCAKLRSLQLQILPALQPAETAALDSFSTLLDSVYLRDDGAAGEGAAGEFTTILEQIL